MAFEEQIAREASYEDFPGNFTIPHIILLFCLFRYLVVISLQVFYRMPKFGRVKQEFCSSFCRSRGGFNLDVEILATTAIHEEVIKGLAFINEMETLAKDPVLPSIVSDLAGVSETIPGFLVLNVLVSLLFDSKR